jgi:hypothetical protein
MSPPPPPPTGAPYFRAYPTYRPHHGDLFFRGDTAGAAPPGRSQRRRVAALACSAGAVIALVVSAVLVFGGGSDAEAAVVNSISSTMADKTANITFTVSGNAGGQTVNATGTGSIDFTQNVMQLTLPISADGQQVTIQEVYVGNTLYENIPGLSQLEPGKSWISVDLSSIEKAAGQSSADTINNPAAMLQLLRQQGNTVTPLGASTVDEVSVQGYEVTITPAALRADLAKDNLPSWMRQAVESVSGGVEQVKVYVDGQGMLRREALSLQMSLGSSPLAMTVSLDFSDYGGPVSVSAPPTDQVVSFQQFLQDAQAAAGSSGSAP